MGLLDKVDNLDDKKTAKPVPKKATPKKAKPKKAAPKKAAPKPAKAKKEKPPKAEKIRPTGLPEVMN